MPLPTGVLREMESLVSQAPPQVLHRCVDTHPDLSRGFGRGRTPSRILRKRIKQAIADGALGPDLASLGCFSPLQVALDALDSKLIEMYARQLMSICGKDRMIAALLIDPRPEMRSFAQQFIAEEYDRPLPQRKAAQAELAPRLGQAVHVMARWVGRGGRRWRRAAAKYEAAALLGAQELHERVEELEAELAGQPERKVQTHPDARSRRHLRELRTHNSELAKELEAVRQRLRKAEQAKDQAIVEKRDLASQLQKAQETSAERVRQGVEDQMRATHNVWLRGLSFTEREVDRIQGSSGQAVLKRADDLLARQARTDQHSGNRRTLQQHLEKLKDALNRVMTSRTEAVRPLPELRDVETDLKNEIAEVSAVLGEGGPFSDGFAKTMAGRIASATSPDDIEQVKSVLDALSDLDVLDTRSIQALYHRHHVQMFKLYAAFTPTIERREYRPDDPVWRLREAIKENQDILVVIDGHNVLHLLSSLFAKTYEDGEPRAASRQALVEQTIQAFRDATSTQVHVFFDSPSPSTERHGSNIWEVYSGGGHGDHRADKAIVGYLERCCREMSAMPRIVVSNDSDLCQKAKELTAGIMRVPQFGAFLGDAQ